MENEVTMGVREFILGGNANFTIYQSSVNGGKSHTEKYGVRKNDNGTCWFVYTGTDNSGSVTEDSNSMVYQGYLNRKLAFNVGKKGSPNYNKKAIDGLLWVLKHADNLPSAVHVLHHGKCSVCGRKLTDVESLMCGVGPTCRKKIGF